MNKAKFPGKSVNKNKRPQVSFHDLDQTTSELPSEFKEAKAQLMVELPALREQFLDDQLEEEFRGFSPNDQLHSVCNKKRAQLKSMVMELEKQNQPVSVSTPGAGKVNGFKAKKIEPTVRVKSKRIANRVPTKRKYPGEESPPRIIQKVQKAVKDVIKRPNDSFKTPKKVEIIQSSVQLEEKKTPKVLIDKDDQKIESVEKLQSDTRVKAASSIAAAQSISDTILPRISNDFFLEKEEYVASVIILTDSRLNQNYDLLKQVKGLVHCGVCLSIAECDNLGLQRKHGAFLCSKCIDFLQKMVKIAKRAEAFTCAGQGACEITSETEYCEACFIRSCLLLLDLNDEIYFKMWRAVPANAKNFVPTKPPVYKRYPNRGKVLYVDMVDGSILKICQFKNYKPENSNGASTQTNGQVKSKGVKRLFPNDEANLAKFPRGPRVKQVSRRVDNPLPIATFGDAMEILGKKSVQEEENKEMLLDRLEEIEKKMIKVLCPLESCEQYGYPITVPKDEELPKPCCFVCGSAGIKQLIFCSACCEPFHPYCADDALLLSAFIIKTVKETKQDEIEIANNCNCSTDYRNPCSSCNPPAITMFRKWKCMKCIKCRLCNKGKLPFKSTKDTDFVKCVQCHDSYHFHCVKKLTSISVKSNDIDKWMCQNCLKCTSCGVRLSKSFQNNFRKISSDDNGNCLEREMLCLECFKRRQKGSFCPICLVCYDDNDWDSKMMECDRCNRWIHSKCEGLNDEQYFILSSLPETVVYSCRLCFGHEHEVGWRQALKADLTDGCNKVLEIFQKKAVGMSRKRRALTFDEEENPPYFIPTVKPENEANVLEIETVTVTEPFLVTTDTESDKPEPIPEVCDEYAELFEKFNIKPCEVKLCDMDVTKRNTPRKTTPPSIQEKTEGRKTRQSGASPLLQKIDAITPVKSPKTDFPTTPTIGKRTRQSGTDNLTSPMKNAQNTPVKVAPNITTPAGQKEQSDINESLAKEFEAQSTLAALEQEPDNQELLLPIDITPTKISTPTRIVTSFTDSIRSMASKGNFWTSVADFRRVCLKLLPSYFLEIDSNSTARFEEYFEDAIKQVFPWFKAPEVGTELVSANTSTSNCSTTAESELIIDVVKRENSPMLIDADTEIFEDEEMISETNNFEEVFWDPAEFMDRRECLFCGELGDFPPNSCGRLLFVGPAEWVHVNCGIWSSEVWEEETGALQQVESALSRSKKISCDFCGYAGASLTCCAATCRRCYHFLCAKDAGCSLMEDKTVFCPGHEASAKGQIQTDMHVMRKVFVDLDVSRKKDIRFWSTEVKVFIGSMRIDRLGQLLPISTLETASSKFLVPVGYKCGRLFWSLPIPKKLELCWLETSIKREGDFRKNFESHHIDFSVVIDHSKRTDCVQSSFVEMQDFFSWINSAPRFIDEEQLEWIFPYIPSTNGRNFKTPTHKNGFKKQKSNVINEDTFKTATFSYPSMINRATIDWNVRGDNLSERFSEYSVGKQYNPTEKSEEKPYNGFINKIGLLHPGITFLMEQLPGAKHVAGNYDFKYHNPIVSPEDTPVKINPSGCARTEGFLGRKPFDMFGWLASRHRKAPPPLRMLEETIKSKGLPIAMRYRNLKERAVKDLVVLPSHIHGRGLFARRDIEMGEMLIEYAGEAIRSPVCDVREKYYDSKEIGCYMFRIDRDLVIDATMKGNAARFINHSCDPNCESKTIKILGKGHILIFALKNIGRGEELTYDYKFEREADKLPCSCSAKKCRKFLN